MRRLIVFSLLALTACTPEQHQAWLDWFDADPRAATSFARNGCGELGCGWTDDTTTEDEAGIADFGKWEPILECESGGDWSYNGGSGYDGGLQFSPGTWDAYGGDEYADYAWGAEPWEQIAIAERVLDGQGWAAWPTCARNAGYL